VQKDVFPITPIFYNLYLSCKHPRKAFFLQNDKCLSLALPQGPLSLESYLSSSLALPQGLFLPPKGPILVSSAPAGVVFPPKTINVQKLVSRNKTMCFKYFLKGSQSQLFEDTLERNQGLGILLAFPGIPARLEELVIGAHEAKSERITAP